MEEVEEVEEVVFVVLTHLVTDVCVWLVLAVCLCHGSSTSPAELAAAGLTDQRPLVSAGDARGAAGRT